MTGLIDETSSNPSDTILELRNLDKRFGGVHALDDVSFNVKSGQIHAIVGENGAGKSTLMKILAGSYKQDHGDIFFTENLLGSTILEKP